MSGILTGEPDGRWPKDMLFMRAAAVLEFIVGHVLVQEQLDPDPERDLADWIALIGGHVGRAAGVVAERPTDADAVRAAADWLACAGAEAWRARLAFSPVDREQQIRQLEAHVISVHALERAWRPAVQIAFVLAALGRLADAAEPIMTADPQAGGPVPPLRTELRALLRQAHPELVAEAAARAAAAEPTDPVKDTIWALEEFAHAAAGAAVQLHPGGAIGIPGEPSRDRP